MELQIVTLIMSCGASFALGMYVSSQVEKDVNRRITKDYFTKRNKEIEVKMSVPDGLEFNKPYSIDAIPEDQKIKEDQLMVEKELEARMNVIGQNGNDGLHYEESDTTDYIRDKVVTLTGGLSSGCGPSERSPEWRKEQYNRNRGVKEQK
tara:strand:+ start:1578 stop:2027 length:450 start_codon:yes stop_codon:yes gene_type:complete